MRWWMHFCASNSPSLFLFIFAADFYWTNRGTNEWKRMGGISATMTLIPRERGDEERKGIRGIDGWMEGRREGGLDKIYSWKWERKLKKIWGAFEDSVGDLKPDQIRDYTPGTNPKIWSEFWSGFGNFDSDLVGWDDDEEDQRNCMGVQEFYWGGGGYPVPLAISLSSTSSFLPLFPSGHKIQICRQLFEGRREEERMGDGAREPPRAWANVINKGGNFGKVPAEPIRGYKKNKINKYL